MTEQKMRSFHLTLVAALAVTALSNGAQAATGSASSTGGPAGKSRPNILFIMTDQQHARMMSCTGNPYVKTPALGRLAAMGTLRRTR